MDEEERQDQRNDKGIINKIKNNVKKEEKSKFKMWLHKMLITLIASKIGIVLIIAFAVMAILAVATHIINIRGSTDVTDVATETVIEETAEIVQAPNPADGYYFQISDDIVNKFLIELNRAYDEGHYLDHIKTGIGDEDYKDEDNDVNNMINGIISGVGNGNVANQSNFVYDPDIAFIKEKDLQDWFNSEDYEDYLIKFIRAEIASMYPKLGNYEGQSTGAGSKDNPKDAQRKLCSTRCSTNSKNFHGSKPEILRVHLKP